MKSTGNRIQARREELGLSREDLANRLKAQGLKTTRMTVWRVENGKQQITADGLKPWARALKTKATELVA